MARVGCAVYDHKVMQMSLAFKLRGWNSLITTSPMIEVQEFTNAKYSFVGSLLSESKIAIPAPKLNYLPVVPNATLQRLPTPLN